jgi:hypothetical protein
MSSYSVRYFYVMNLHMCLMSSYGIKVPNTHKMFSGFPFPAERAANKQRLRSINPQWIRNHRPLPLLCGEGHFKAASGAGGERGGVRRSESAP